MRRKHHRRSTRRHPARRSHRVRSLRRNPKIKTGALLGLAVVGGLAVWFLYGNKKKEWETAGVLPPGTGEVIPVETPAGKTIPASKQVGVPKEAPMPDWMKAAIAAGALIPGALPGTLVINAGYDWFKSDTPWWQKAGIAAGFLVPGAAMGTFLMNAVYDWFKS